jgi:hypothetical protein
MLYRFHQVGARRLVPDDVIPGDAGRGLQQVLGDRFAQSAFLGLEAFTIRIGAAP